MSKISPDALGRPWYGTPYQLATPVSVEPVFSGTEAGTEAGTEGGAGVRAALRRAQPAANSISVSALVSSIRAMCARPAKISLRSTETILLDLVLSIPGPGERVDVPSHPPSQFIFFLTFHGFHLIKGTRP